MTADPHAGGALLRRGPARGRRALVLLHGRGAGAESMLALGAAIAPEAALFAPEAAGRSWWPTSFLEPMSQLEPWLSSAVAATERAVGAARAEGFEDGAVVLFGFSQGGCLALEYAARAARRLGGVCAASGALVGAGDAEGDPSADLHGRRPKRFDYPPQPPGLRMHIGCHAADPHIPLRRVRESEAVFSALGADCRSTIAPGAGHDVLEADVEAVRAFLG